MNNAAYDNLESYIEELAAKQAQTKAQMVVDLRAVACTYERLAESLAVGTAAADSVLTEAYLKSEPLNEIAKTAAEFKVMKQTIAELESHLHDLSMD